MGPAGLSAFFASFGFAYLAATLLASAAGHLAALARFRDLVRSHAILPPRLVMPGVLGVLGFELVGGVAALLFAVERRPPTAPVVVLCAASAVAGLAFVLYVRRLLRTVAAAPCGCSPLSGPTTSASLVLGAALALVSVVALAATVAQAASGGEVEGIALVLAPAWGVTMAALTMLVPASMPAPPAPATVR
ncbi:MAG: MauE/DoxX family redox-associated membrane protein [Solirubrobacteraceae bacterium]